MLNMKTVRQVIKQTNFFVKWIKFRTQHATSVSLLWGLSGNTSLIRQEFNILHYIKQKQLKDSSHFCNFERYWGLRQFLNKCNTRHLHGLLISKFSTYISPPILFMEVSFSISKQALVVNLQPYGQSCSHSKNLYGLW